MAKACLDYGQRVQNSVFECVVTEAQYSLLKGRVRDIINMFEEKRFLFVSIHTPTQGVTIICISQMLLPLGFNPHTHAGCDSDMHGLRERMLFQSTHPRRV